MQGEDKMNNPLCRIRLFHLPKLWEVPPGSGPVIGDQDTLSLHHCVRILIIYGGVGGGTELSGVHCYI